MATFEKYQSETRKLKGFTFSGRLATYRYMDMHNVIEEALEIAGRFK
jgi:UDP-galactopyranose mutase